MMVVVSYDVSTITEGGQRRLRRVAKQCVNYGQRVQNSVFECVLDPMQLEELRNKLLEIIDLETDSIRFYNVGKNWKNKTQHFGSKKIIDIEEPIIL
jgi:CRISPR-associated protein Cas2